MAVRAAGLQLHPGCPLGMAGAGLVKSFWSEGWGGRAEQGKRCPLHVPAVSIAWHGMV